jgi:apolipoprotein D and lipocalin family protein
LQEDDTMMKKTLPVAALAAAAAGIGAWALREAFFAGPVGNRSVPEPAKPVDLSRYVGRWYEMARYENRFERGCEAVTAQYSLRDDGLIDVVNTCGKEVDNGKARISRGKAKVVEGSGNAKLKVSFLGPFYVGDYWVLDHADDYSWSIVGEPSGRYLWILTRQRAPDEFTRQMLMQRVRSLGYDDTLVRPTQQAPLLPAN